MRRFIKQISIFAIVFSLFAIFLLAFTSYLANDRVLLLVDSESDKLILGHSRPECAYDDRLISGVKNISDSGSPTSILI